MSRNRYDGGCLSSLLAWVAIMLIIEIYGKYETMRIPIIVGGVSIFLILYVNGKLKERRCKHGVIDGKTIGKNGKFKCAECQSEYEEIQRKRQIEKEKQEQALLLELQRQEKEKRLKDEYNKAINDAASIWKEYLLSKKSFITQLTSTEFEDFSADLLKRMGYDNIIQTPYVSDGGKDIICTKYGIKYYVECKHYSEANVVSRPLLQKLFAAMNEDKVTKGIFITTSSFSDGALEYGKKYNILTIDKNELFNLIERYIPKPGKPYTYTLPCPICGEKVLFHYSSVAEHVSCSNGHIVEGISRDSLFPHKEKKSSVIKKNSTKNILRKF